jgi:hypothetical protein
VVVDVVVLVVVVVTVVDDDVLVSWEGVVLLTVPVSVGAVAVQAMAMSNKSNRHSQCGFSYCIVASIARYAPVGCGRENTSTLSSLWSARYR